MGLTLIGLVVGAALALLRFKVFILFPVIGLGLLGTATMGIVHSDQIGSMVLTMVLIGMTLQLGYLAGIGASAVFASIGESPANEPRNQQDFGVFKSIDVQSQMEVVGSDGEHVGRVDHKEAAGRIILTKDDPNAAGRAHLISVKWVDYVDDKIHLNKPSKSVMREWQVA